ncbi:unnamed protein product [Lactuca saligna]|uniref:NLP1-9 GAF domain-containing protein n=1 Tax=Lactuca saligna TaxID=75948 RepID=A0AA35ZRN0_LACSI|nr:unnamed protein product [Lactuca saligna]
MVPNRFPKGNRFDLIISPEETDLNPLDDYQEFFNDRLTRQTWGPCEGRSGPIYVIESASYVFDPEILGFFEATSTQQLVSGEGSAGKALGTNQQLIPAARRENETHSHYGTVLNVHQQQMSQGDGYGSSTTDSSRTGNFYVPTTSNTSMMNNQSSCIRNDKGDTLTALYYHIVKPLTNTTVSALYYPVSPL